MIEFFDTSALVKRYVREPGSDAVGRVVRGGHVAVARITQVELTATLARVWRETGMEVDVRDAMLDRVDADFRLFDVVEWRGALARSARPLLCRRSLRALDAVQLASALALGTRRMRFWCFDARLAAAASAEGLRVVDSVR